MRMVRAGPRSLCRAERGVVTVRATCAHDRGSRAPQPRLPEFRVIARGRVLLGGIPVRTYRISADEGALTFIGDGDGSDSTLVQRKRSQDRSCRGGPVPQWCSGGPRRRSHLEMAKQIQSLCSPMRVEAHAAPSRIRSGSCFVPVALSSTTSSGAAAFMHREVLNPLDLLRCSKSDGLMVRSLGSGTDLAPTVTAGRSQHGRCRRGLMQTERQIAPPVGAPARGSNASTHDARPAIHPPFCRT